MNEAATPIRGRFAREALLRTINPIEPANRPMTPGTIIANFKPTYPTTNNVESRAGIGQPEGAAGSGSTFAVPAMASAMSAPIETGDLI